MMIGYAILAAQQAFVITSLQICLIFQYMELEHLLIH
jgi:hypothetical protein